MKHLYVPGHIGDTRTVLVDVGTNYYVRKTVPKAQEFLQRKVQYLRDNISSIEAIFEQKQGVLETVMQLAREAGFHHYITSTQTRSLQFFSLRFSSRFIKPAGQLPKPKNKPSSCMIETIIWITFVAFFGLLFLIFMCSCFRNIVVVHQGEAMIVERFGKFHAKLEGGIHCLIPGMDQRRTLVWRYTESDLNFDYVSGGYRPQVTLVEKHIDRIDLRDSLVDLPFQSIITRDNVQIEVHPMMVYRIHDPVRAAYEVFDLFNAVERIVQTTLRSIIGDMGLDDTLASREEINKLITQKIHNILWNWGLQLLKFEILEINPPHHPQAEGQCQAQIAVSKGQQQVKIIAARALAESKVLIAKAEADSVRIVGEALREYGVDPVQYLCALKYIDAFSDVATRAAQRHIYFPFNTGVVGSLKDLSSFPALPPQALGQPSPAPAPSASPLGGAAASPLMGMPPPMMPLMPVAPQ
ncbi:putative band 7/Mec-2 family protein [Paratrimastix pyriformis]|uniref:Band 7/Mec-2 family protein n=1 Tax=Paratrimastix pyriformis TaxID=342808 RepID=A0ABQ8UGX3_9EUKA|nr:putative band 7/Mec-2 family protein [Paratrimastix pyriformis]